MNAKQIIEKIAREKNMTPDAVEEEMRNAIQQAMRNQDPKVQKLWQELAPDGKEPSLEKFLSFCVKRIKERNEDLQ